MITYDVVVTNRSFMDRWCHNSGSVEFDAEARMGGSSGEDNPRNSLASNRIFLSAALFLLVICLRGTLPSAGEACVGG